MREDWRALSSTLAGFLGPETSTAALVALTWPGAPATHSRLCIAGMVLIAGGWTGARPGHKVRVRVYRRPADQAQHSAA